MFYKEKKRFNQRLCFAKKKEKIHKHENLILFNFDFFCDAVIIVGVGIIYLFIFGSMEDMFSRCIVHSGMDGIEGKSRFRIIG